MQLDRLLNCHRGFSHALIHTAFTVLLIAALAGPARAQTRTFASGSLIIPMDYCYQTAQSTTNLSAPPAYCVSPTNTLYKTDGVLLAYGLVYRLSQKGINVYVIINPAKSRMDDIDMTVTSLAGAPVNYVNTTTGTMVEFMSATAPKIDYRGMPFVIDATQAATALALIKSDAALTNFTGTVVIHNAKQSFNAPVKMVLSSQPPRIAVNNLGGAASGVLTSYLTSAGLNTAGASGVYPTTTGDVFDEFNNDTDFTTGGLLKGGYKILWAPHWGGDSQSAGVYKAVSDFVDAGNAYFSECASIETQEGLYGGGKWGTAPAGNAQYQSTMGLTKNGLGTFPAATGDHWVYGDATMTLVQTGDYVFQTNGGSVHSWQPTAPTSIYRPGLIRMISSLSPSKPTLNDWDVYTYIRKDNDPAKGPIVYLGGHSYAGDVAGTRLVLNTLLFLGQAIATKELARSSPIVNTDGKSYQGTYVATSIAAAAYPPVAGHFREYPVGGLAGSLVTAFAKVAADWDAAAGIPASSTRNVFTAAPVNGKVTQTPFTASNASVLAARMNLASAALATTAINGIRAGGLGGIDHSTPAVAGPSKVAGSAARPTVAYVGALDGMLHAIAVSGSGVTPGTELWAFIPPSQLGTIATYQAGVDGSPQVADAFLDDGKGIKSWRTVLAVTCGQTFGGTVDLLDVTDPLNPAWLWTGSSSTGSGAYAMGAASGAAFGLVRQAGPLSLVYVATNNAGSGGNGFNLYALDASNGQVVWQWNRSYTRHVSGSTSLVPNEVPGVPAVTNTSGDGAFDDLVLFGDLDGRLWRVDATLKSGAPSTPLFDAGADGFPFGGSIAIYRDATTQRLVAFGATGGRDWVPNTLTPFVLAVEAERFQNGVSGAGVVLYRTNLAAGESVYAAPLVVGNDAYLITSFGSLGGSINGSSGDAGNVRRINLTNGSVDLTAAVKKGAGAVSLELDGSVVATSAAGISNLGNAGRDATSVALENRTRPVIVQAWLDLH